jgi:hypothetical protein
VSEQLELLSDEQPYYLDYRDYCRVWELRARRGNGTGLGLKQFDNRRAAREALEWMLNDWKRTGELRRQYPKEAPHWNTRPNR